MDKITKELMNLGCDPSLRGFRYARAAIDCMIKAGDDAPNVKITKELYPEIAKMYSVTRTGVERDIRYMVERAFLTGKPEKAERVFGQYMTADKGVVTNKTFISVMAERLR